VLTYRRRGDVDATSSEQPPVTVRLFRSLAVAAATLTPREAEVLRADDAVEDVVVNALRAIPRPVEPAPAEPGASVQEAYLRGLRDAADLALRQMRGFDEVPAQEPGPRAAAMPQAGHSWALEMIGVGADKAFTGEGVRVAVLDTGLDFTHPDFRDRDILSRSFIEGVASAQDGNGHGTHCCGIVAGPVQPHRGPRYGVAPDVELIVGKVLDDSGSGYDDGIAEGIQWAYDAGAQIISLSLGSARQINGTHSRLYESLAAPLLIGQDGERTALLIAATGNESQRPRTRRPVGNPAACPSIMGVAAVDRSGIVAPFSDCQLDPIGTVDLAAPGVRVHSSWTGGGYWSESGTSMACPHVSGVAALYLEKSPALSAQALWAALSASAKPIGSYVDVGHGLVQAPAYP
jgi:subtilisin family serine protease